MRVTKIIREYVERTVGAKYSEKIEELYEERLTVMPANLREFSGALECIEATLVRDVLNEIGRFQVELQKRPSYIEQDDNKFIAKCIHVGFDDIVKNMVNPERKRIDDDINILRREKQEKIDSILIGLEIGEIDKKKLDEVLEPYK